MAFQEILTPQTIQPTGMKKEIPEEVISVLFVPRTPHSELAKMIREDERTISKLSGYRIKIVERCGTKLVDLLRNKGASYAQPCNREKCHPCNPTNQPAGRIPCWDRSVLYRAYCIPCKDKGITAEYIGETGKSLHQRSVSHYEAFRYRRTHSFMIRHQVRSHPLEDLENTRFGWEVISKEPTCLRRQVSEAIRIKESRDKESLQRDQIINRYLSEPKPETEPNQKPEPEPNKTENLAKCKPSKTKPEPPP